MAIEPLLAGGQSSGAGQEGRERHQGSAPRVWGALELIGDSPLYPASHPEEKLLLAVFTRGGCPGGRWRCGSLPPAPEEYSH